MTSGVKRTYYIYIYSWKVEKSDLYPSGVICHTALYPPRGKQWIFLPFQVNVSLERPLLLPHSLFHPATFETTKLHGCRNAAATPRTPPLGRDDDAFSSLSQSRKAQNFLKSHPLFAAFYSPPNRKSQRERRARESSALCTKLFIKVDAASVCWKIHFSCPARALHSIVRAAKTLEGFPSFLYFLFLFFYTVCLVKLKVIKVTKANVKLYNVQSTFCSLSLSLEFHTAVLEKYLRNFYIIVGGSYMSISFQIKKSF